MKYRSNMKCADLAQIIQFFLYWFVLNLIFFWLSSFIVSYSLLTLLYIQFQINAVVPANMIITTITWAVEAYTHFYGAKMPALPVFMWVQSKMQRIKDIAWCFRSFALYISFECSLWINTTIEQWLGTNKANMEDLKNGMDEDETMEKRRNEVVEQAMEYKTIHTSIYLILSKQSRMQPGST